MKDKLRSISLFFLLSLIPVILLANFTGLFLWRFNHYQVYQDFRFDRTIVDQNFEGLIKHINPPFLELNSAFFSAEDIAHMRDVQTIMIGIYSIVVISLIILFTLRINKRSIDSIQSIWWKWLTFVSLVGVFAVFAWTQTFELFHRIFFPTNTLWQLDPASSNLIKYFNNPIFQEIFFILIGIWLIEELILVLLQKTILKEQNSTSY